MNMVDTHEIFRILNIITSHVLYRTGNLTLYATLSSRNQVASIRL